MWCLIRMFIVVAFSRHIGGARLGLVVFRFLCGAAFGIGCSAGIGNAGNLPDIGRLITVATHRPYKKQKRAESGDYASFFHFVHPFSITK